MIIKPDCSLDVSGLLHSNIYGTQILSFQASRPSQQVHVVFMERKSLEAMDGFEKQARQSRITPMVSVPTARDEKSREW